MKTVFGIIGGAGAGKDIAGEYVAKKLAIPKYEISQTIKDIARARGVDPTRKKLIELGSVLDREYGLAYLAQVLLDKINTKGVITGMRGLEQINYLKKNSRLILIALTAPVDLRFARVADRGKYGEVGTLADFIKEEQWENSGESTKRLFDCIAMADYEIINESTIDLLYNELDKILVQGELL